MSAYQTNLLRRTAVAFAAVAGFLIAAPSQAAVVTLTGASGNTCTYSSMSVQPDGSFNVSCSVPPTTTPTPTPTPTPGAAGQFAFVSATGTTASVGGNYQFPVSRVNGSTGNVSIVYTVAGAGCTNGVGTLTFPDGISTAQNAQIWALTANSNCTITLGTPTTTSTVTTQPTLGAVTTMTISVAPSSSTNPNPTPPPGTCPTGFTTPSDLLSMNLGGLGNPLLAMAKSNQTISMPLPAVQPGFSTGQIAFGESAGGAYTPQPVTLQISISQCPGLVDPDTTNRCNLTSSNGNYNSITWFAQPYSVIKDPSSANLRGYCWAPASQGQWYINAKWTYSQCAFGAATCGFAIQQNYGPY